MASILPSGLGSPYVTGGSGSSGVGPAAGGVANGAGSVTETNGIPGLANYLSTTLGLSGLADPVSPGDAAALLGEVTAALKQALAQSNENSATDNDAQMEQVLQWLGQLQGALQSQAAGQTQIQSDQNQISAATAAGNASQVQSLQTDINNQQATITTDVAEENAYTNDIDQAVAQASNQTALNASQNSNANSTDSLLTDVLSDLDQTSNSMLSASLTQAQTANLVQNVLAAIAALASVAGVSPPQSNASPQQVSGGSAA
jgi:hypothetical protein